MCAKPRAEPPAAEGFNRKVGEFAGQRISPSGDLLSKEAWQARGKDWLPSDQDLAFIGSLMKPCHHPVGTPAGLRLRVWTSTGSRSIAST